MKKKRKKIIITILIIIFILLLLTVGIALAFYMSVKKEEESKGLIFYLPRSNSPASNWLCEVSNENVLQEIEDETYDYFIFYQYDYFEFKAIESGEVTIFFEAQCATEIVEEECFSITYYVDENYNITEISSENKPEKINYDDDIIGLMKLKIADRITVFLINIFARIVSLLNL